MLVRVVDYKNDGGKGCDDGTYASVYVLLLLLFIFFIIS